jgi:hypothetical protein
MSQGNLAPFIRSALQAGAASWRCQAAHVFHWQSSACFATIASCAVRTFSLIASQIGCGEVLEWPNRAAC